MNAISTNPCALEQLLKEHKNRSRYGRTYQKGTASSAADDQLIDGGEESNTTLADDQLIVGGEESNTTSADDQLIVGEEYDMDMGGE